MNRSFNVASDLAVGKSAAAFRCRWLKLRNNLWYQDYALWPHMKVRAIVG
jgi:hypothetical protein